MVDKNFFEDLKYRGLIYQATDEVALEEQLQKGPVGVYCGFDPTAKSMHLGNLVMILTLKRFELAGHKTYALVGGSTGLVGDPGGRTEERQLNTEETVKGYVEGLKGQLKRFLDVGGKTRLVNNYDWAKDISMISFLRDYGKNFNINYMLAKDTVKSRLETGISYTEFSYMILQSLDFKHLYEKENVQLQIGGQDQWGNITAGFELIRKTIPNSKAFAMTVPLLTKADGSKFGKTAGGAVWLEKDLTSPYEMYQFLINTSDADVEKMLKVFTFLTRDEIEGTLAKHEEAPHQRHAQKVLAEQLVTIVHGQDATNQAIAITKALFSGNIKELNIEQIEQGFKDVPSLDVTDEKTLVDTLVEVGGASSKRQAREFISNNSISVNGEKVSDLNAVVNKENAIQNKFTVLRRGKKHYFLVKHI